MPTPRKASDILLESVETAIAAHQPAWNAYAQWAPQRVRKQAAELIADVEKGATPGPLYGVSVSVKDNMGLNGWTMCGGGTVALPNKWQKDTALVARLRRAGALFTGLTQTVPFCFTSLGVTLEGKGPRNPHDPSRVCGGSSSGAAVSVVEGSAQLALGSDTAGSVRVPAAICGIVGLKLGTGHWPGGGMLPLSPHLDSLGIMASDMKTLAKHLHALGEPCLPTPSLSDIRLGVLESAPRVTADAGIDTAFAETLRQLETCGATLVSVDLPEATDADTLFKSGGLVAADLDAFLTRHLPEWRHQPLGMPLDAAMQRAVKVTREEYSHRLKQRRALVQRGKTALKRAGVDALVLPTTPLTPPQRLCITTPEAYGLADERILRHAGFINYLDWCGISLPAGKDALGMPVGFQLAMPAGKEHQLVALALAIESSTTD
ncbi:amidase [Halomonas halocynthiae]|uniref:amidase n=1 Tax=Halomonas halocynthiae TaxID=176290 RepID=UPI0004172078|nr:amidase [Halomonas halocynthiae]